MGIGQTGPTDRYTLTLRAAPARSWRRLSWCVDGVGRLEPVNDVGQAALATIGSGWPKRPGL